MMELNKYGFVSGGYIVDQMDRVALTAINTEFPDTKNDLLFTSSCSVKFLKQLCNTKNIVFLTTIETSVEHSVVTRVKLLQNDTLIAEGCFTFVKADHNYCKIKGDNK